MTVDIGAAPTTTAALLYAESAQGGAPPDSDLQAALDELATARGGYQEAEEYFEGTYPEYFASLRMRIAMRRTGARFRLNFARGPVRAVADRLEIASITCDDEEANRVLQDIWEDNELDLEAPTIHERAAEFGDAYAIVWPASNDDDEQPGEYEHQDRDTFEGENEPDLVDTDADGLVNIDIFYNSPQSVRVFYDPERPRKKAFAVKRWMLSNTKKVRVDLYYPDRVERYISKPGVLDPDATQMELFTEDDQPGEIDNPFGWIPVYHFRTRRPYGRPVHRDFYGAQDAIHKLIISHMSGVDYQSIRQRYIIGADDADSSEATGIDEDEFAFPIEDGSTRPAQDPQSQLSAEPGSVWWLQRVKQVGEFEEADPHVFLDPIQIYLRAGAQICETPIWLMDPDGNPPSGESRRREEGPFVKLVEAIQRSFGATWRELLTDALRMAGRDPNHLDQPGRFEDVKLQVQWKPAAVVDDLESWQVVSAKLAAGMPVKEAFMQAGFTDTQVKDWFGDDPGDDIPQKVDQLIKIAGALQAFSAAAATGMFSEDEIRTVIVAFLGEVGIDTTGETDGSPAWEPISNSATPPPSLTADESLSSR